MALRVQLLSLKMNRLVVLILILFSSLAYAASSGSFDMDDEGTAKPVAPAAKAQPVAKASPTPAAKPAPAAKPDNDDDEGDDDDDDEEEVQPAPKPRESSLRSAARDRARGGSLDDRDAEGGYCKYCSRASERERMTIRYTSITAPRDVLNSSIWGDFKRAFEECAPGCQPVGMGSYRDPYARPKPSCHHISAAIDVAGMRCGGSLYMSKKETVPGGRPSGRFTTTVKCMERKGLRLIYNSADHYDHAHFSHGCRLPSGVRMFK